MIRIINIKLMNDKMMIEIHLLICLKSEKPMSMIIMIYLINYVISHILIVNTPIHIVYSTNSSSILHNYF